jgi:hypothetical protein
MTVMGWVCWLTGGGVNHYETYRLAATILSLERCCDRYDVDRVLYY